MDTRKDQVTIIAAQNSSIGLEGSARERQKTISTIPGGALLFAGLVLFVLSQLRWGIDILAWFSPVPFLLYLRREESRRSSLKLLAILLLGSHLAVAKIVTPPLNFFMVPLFALPIGVAVWLPYFIWKRMFQRSGEWKAIYLFPSLVVVVEWMQSHLTEFGVWGTMAATQINHLPILQIASVFGTGAISFLVAWGASLLATILRRPGDRRWSIHAIAFVAALGAALLYGSIRLTREIPGPAVRVAGINSDLIITESTRVDEGMHRNTKSMLERSRKAADSGAKFITWNEGSTVLLPDEEKPFLKEAAMLARTKGIEFIPAYILLRSEQPFRYDNKFVWIHNDGSIAEDYLKHHPVPGERATRGTASLQIVRTKFGNAAGAICYDYDFPAMSRRHGEMGAGLVLLPSSDWKGIDPIHTLMSRLRAIEGGFSLLRSARASTSMGFDAYGRIQGSLSYFAKSDGILLVTLPVEHVKTIYSITGDAFVLLSTFYIAIVFMVSLKSGKKKEGFA